MTYNNGPATSGHIALTSNGASSWASNLTLSTPFTTQVTAEDTDYPTSKDTYIRFTLTASDGVDNDSTKYTQIYFRNNIFWGALNKASGFTEADVEGLSNSEISNDQTRTMSINAGAGEYLVFAFPSSYTSIPDGTDYETDGGTGFLFNSIACGFSAPETVSITNSAGFTENYKVYASTVANLGNHNLVTTTNASSINPLK